MRKIRTNDTEADLARFLFHYRNTPHTTNGASPAELLLKRRPRSPLTILQPSTSSRVRTTQTQQKSGHDQHAIDKNIALDDSVFVRNFAPSGPTWLPGTIIETRGGLTTLSWMMDVCFAGTYDDVHVQLLLHALIQRLMISYHLQWTTLPNQPQPVVNVPPAAPRRSTRQTHPPERLM